MVDIAEPANPRFVAHYRTWTGPGRRFFEGAIGLDVHADAGVVYVADSARLLVLRESF